MHKFPVVVPAAGVGKRMQADRPKQYLHLHGKTLLEHTLHALHAHPRIGQIYLALHPQDPYFGHLPIADADWLTRVDGGLERADSVLAGLNQIMDADWVLVHDAARPCLRHQDIDALLSLADGQHGGILACPVRDSMKRGNGAGLVATSVCRDDLWHALTPQFFPLPALREALQHALTEGHTITDEASAMELASHPVALVEGSPDNIKITHPQDLALAELYLTERSKDFL
ncbi:2-C-methyl-D-erythritol 4-phosphate cytidylyltransferase [Pseudobowmanella zhangzhouensis]|uniref:2-C-methyl-D-erythritol 4-phosphate cytidylyltransferase n=1 Tax=Pseudobowmanella zhangzhouensis TaxID=1537679 RepID=A0ABW1XJ30_9ALTE